MTSTVLYKTRCPECAKKGKDRSGDNLAVYSDGHSYCFGCGYVTGDNIKLRQEKKPSTSIELPEDIDWTIPPKPTKWLQQYFDYKDIPKHTFWSESKQQLIFPIYDDPIKPSQLLAYQARNFNNNSKYPKWIGYGISDKTIFTIGKTTPDCSVVLVEDIISCYKVGHITHTMCIFGSNISYQRLAMLALLGYKEIIIWLDYDKRFESMTYASRAQSLGLKARSIITQNDPKDYSYNEIAYELQIPN